MKNNYALLYWNGVNWMDVDTINHSKIQRWIPYLNEVEDEDTIAVIFKIKAADSLL